MIIQAIGLLDDLDKELNTYAVRVQECYGGIFRSSLDCPGEHSICEDGEAHG